MSQHATTPGTAAVELALDGSENRLDPRVRAVWMISGAIPLAILTIAGAIAASVVLTDRLEVVAAIVIGGLLAMVLRVWWAVLQWSRWRWATWSDALELSYGVVFRRSSLVPYHRIQQIDVRRGPLERAFGVATLDVHSAAATTDALIPGVATEHAQALRRALLERAGLDDAA